MFPGRGQSGRGEVEWWTVNVHTVALHYSEQRLLHCVQNKKGKKLCGKIFLVESIPDLKFEI